MFVIIGSYRNKVAYYFDSYLDKSTGYVFRKFSTTIEGAKKFKSIAQANKTLSKLNCESFEIYPICPICKSVYIDRPATLRKDNKTEICSNCSCN